MISLTEHEIVTSVILFLNEVKFVAGVIYITLPLKNGFGLF